MFPDYRASVQQRWRRSGGGTLGLLLRRRFFPAFGLLWRIVFGRVKPDTKLFAGLKIGDELLRYLDLVACAWIAFMATADKRKHRNELAAWLLEDMQALESQHITEE